MGTGLGQGLQSDGYNLSDECVRRGGGITAMAARVLGVLVTVMGMFREPMAVGRSPCDFVTWMSSRKK